MPDLQSGALAAWRRAQIGTEGEIRTLEASLEDSHVSSYITSASGASQGNARFWVWREIVLWTANGTPGRTRTRNLDVRSVALFHLSYRSEKHFRLLIFDCRF